MLIYSNITCNNLDNPICNVPSVNDLCWQTHTRTLLHKHQNWVLCTSTNISASAVVMLYSYPRWCFFCYSTLMTGASCLSPTYWWQHIGFKDQVKRSSLKSVIWLFSQWHSARKIWISSSFFFFKLCMMLLTQKKQHFITIIISSNTSKTMYRRSEQYLASGKVHFYLRQ